MSKGFLSSSIRCGPGIRGGAEELLLESNDETEDDESLSESEHEAEEWVLESESEDEDEATDSLLDIENPALRSRSRGSSGMDRPSDSPARGSERLYNAKMTRAEKERLAEMDLKDNEIKESKVGPQPPLKRPRGGDSIPEPLSEAHTSIKRPRFSTVSLAGI